MRKRILIVGSSELDFPISWLQCMRKHLLIEMKKCTWYAGIIIVVAWMVAIISLLEVCVFLDNERVQRSIENYNNGICRECGEALEYRGSSRNQHSRYDYYICPNGHVVEVCKG